MIRKHKKIVIGMIATCCLAIGAIASNSYASGNISDTSFTYSFSGDTSYRYTPARVKNDSTSAYMKLTSITDGAGGYTAEVVDSNNNYFSKRWPVSFYDPLNGLPLEKYISNYALEDNNGRPTDVKIEGKGYRGATSSSSWSAKGVWSPDSI